jgi:hypothetical protein
MPVFMRGSTSAYLLLYDGMDEGSSWTGSPFGYTRDPMSRWESARYAAVLGEQHLPERHAEAKVCSQEGMLD